ncbi:putative divalent cation/proton antiporter TMEM165 isoform X2 [Asterias amurensis]|uniref:putative divalent cation/proton antiporter TMEM165 isoform X2 n=1 Tax=Asterias amurensis TaxID=7602 RepID=UPI003AB3E4ED
MQLTLNMPRSGAIATSCTLVVVLCLLICKVHGDVEHREAHHVQRFVLQHNEKGDDSENKKPAISDSDEAVKAPVDEQKEQQPFIEEDKQQDEVKQQHNVNQIPLAEPIDGQVNLGFVHAFVASLSVIIVSELGDKTFFIAAIMAMRHARLTVFVGALGALAVMTVLSTLLGYATTVIPRWFTYYASTFLFALFGLRMLREGWYMSADEGQEELEEVQADLKRRDEEMEKAAMATVTQDPESGIVRGGKQRKIFGIFSPIFLQAFSLTFLAEWGDRSQITTIILAAREDVFGVSIGGILGHALCTALAVIGGRMIAQRISARTVTLVGGVVFLVFALSALFVSHD